METARKNVLIVEDNEDNVIIYTTILEVQLLSRERRE